MVARSSAHPCAASPSSPCCSPPRPAAPRSNPTSRSAWRPSPGSAAATCSAASTWPNALIDFQLEGRSPWVTAPSSTSAAGSRPRAAAASRNWPAFSTSGPASQRPGHARALVHLPRLRRLSFFDHGVDLGLSATLYPTEDLGLHPGRLSRLRSRRLVRQGRVRLVDPHRRGHLPRAHAAAQLGRRLLRPRRHERLLRPRLLHLQHQPHASPSPPSSGGRSNSTTTAGDGDEFFGGLWLELVF